MAEMTKNGLIHINRGDSFSFDVLINTGTEVSPVLPELKEGDEVYFGVMAPNQPFEHALIRKMYTDFDEGNYVTISLKPTDTIDLIPGTYYYQIKLQTAEGVYTIVDKHKFIILG